MKHLTQKDALNYISGKLSENEILVVDEHLVACHQCQKRVKGMRALREDFDRVWNRWNLLYHAAAYFRSEMSDTPLQSHPALAYMGIFEALEYPDDFAPAI